MKKYIETRGLKLEIAHEVYSPKEDSFLVVDTLAGQDLAWTYLCEIGPGSGIISLSLGDRSSTIITSEINPVAAEQTHNNARHNRFDNVLTVCSDRLKPFRKGAMPEIIIFNPPYLPEDPEIDPYSPTWENQQLVGGRKGDETISELVRSLSAEDHTVYTIISSLATNPVEFGNNHPEWKVRVLKGKNVGFETIWLLRMEASH